MSATSLLSAAAASLAAALAAINLYVLGRRERHQWLRGTLVDEYASFLDASFKVTHRARDYIGNPLAEVDSGPRSTIENEIRSLRRKQMDTLTRLRLLAAAEIVHAATQVYVADNAVIDLLARPGSLLTDSDLGAARQNVYERREDFIRVARKSMKIPGAIAKVEPVSSGQATQDKSVL